MWGGRLQHLSQFSTVCVYVCILCTCISLYFYACFVRKSRLQTKCNKGNWTPVRQFEARSREVKERVCFFAAVITRHTLLLFHAWARVCMRPCVHARGLNFRTLVKCRNTHTLNLPRTRSAIMTGAQVASMCLLHTKLLHDCTLQIRVCLYWEFTPTDEQANAMAQQAQCTRGMICLH